MMIGIHDRQAIREVVKEKEKEKEKPARGTAAQGAQNKAQNQAQSQASDNPPDQDAEQPAIVAPEPQRNRTPGIDEFRSQRWEEVYDKKIDDTIAALKSRNVPVAWVGLPALRGAKSTSDISYLNELYRARAERAGITFVDVWDGFVDESGKFTTQGPDLEGQIRRLRTGDGVHFTKFGARKLAHYVEREIRRAISPLPVALPMPEQPAPQVKPKPGVVMPRPLAGVQVPLVIAPKGSEDLAGGSVGRPAGADPVATNVLVKGEAVPAPAGRSDDFAWPRRDIAPVGTDPVATLTTVPTQSAKHQEEAARAAAAAEGKETREAGTQPLPPDGPPPPQRPRLAPRGWTQPFFSLWNTLR
jgi:hypothetical protein